MILLLTELYRTKNTNTYNSKTKKMSTVIERALLSRLPKDFDLTRVTIVSVPLCFGDPRNLNDGCHDRFDEAVKNLSKSFSKTLIIQTGGTKEKPLCSKMLKVIKSDGNHLWAPRFLSIPLGWGTRSEIANAFSIIQIILTKYQQNGIDTRPYEFKVIISSNKAHMPRIKWFVETYNVNNVPVEYREAKHYFGLKNTIRERIGTPLIKIKDSFLGRKYLLKKQERDFLDKF
jgi:hypothetical protein